MPSIADLFAPLALLLPVASVDTSPAAGMEAEWAAASVAQGSLLIDEASDRGLFSGLPQYDLGDDTWNQVRIERRMIIRIAPRLPGSSFILPLRPPEPPRFRERKTANCLPIASISGVQPDESDRLLLITRGRKLIGASLEKSCRARDFYSGFYVERNEDGQLCAGRDMIHSRAGANCAVTKMRELVPDDD